MFKCTLLAKSLFFDKFVAIFCKNMALVQNFCGEFFLAEFVSGYFKAKKNPQWPCHKKQNFFLRLPLGLQVKIKDLTKTMFMENTQRNNLYLFTITLQSGYRNSKSMFAILSCFNASCARVKAFFSIILSNSTCFTLHARKPNALPSNPSTMLKSGFYQIHLFRLT